MKRSLKSMISLLMALLLCLPLLPAAAGADAAPTEEPQPAAEAPDMPEEPERTETQPEAEAAEALKAVLPEGGELTVLSTEQTRDGKTFLAASYELPYPDDTTLTQSPGDTRPSFTVHNPYDNGAILKFPDSNGEIPTNFGTKFIVLTCDAVDDIYQYEGMNVQVCYPGSKGIPGNPDRDPEQEYVQEFYINGTNLTAVNRTDNRNKLYMLAGEVFEGSFDWRLTNGIDENDFITGTTTVWMQLPGKVVSGEHQHLNVQIDAPYGTDYYPPGYTVTATVKPNYGYTLDASTLRVVGTNGGESVLTPTGNPDEYTFTMPRGNAMVYGDTECVIPYWIYGEIVSYEPLAFEQNATTGLWECEIEIDMGEEGLYGMELTEFEVRAAGDDPDGDWYGADATKSVSVGERTYVFDSVRNLPLIYNESYNGNENAKRTFLVASHSGTYKFILNPANRTLSVEHTYTDPTAEPYVYILGFQNQDERPFPMGDVMGAIAANAEGNGFWTTPAESEVPGKGGDGPFGADDTILWSTFEMTGGDEEWVQWFFIGSDGSIYGKNSPIIRDIPVEGFELQLAAGSDICRFICTLASTATGVYDFYYGSESHKLVVKRRVVSVEYDADLIAATRNGQGLPQPTISVDGTILSGDEVTLTADYVPGYRFLGWFAGDYSVNEETGEIDDDPETEAFAYTFYPKDDAELHAVYAPAEALAIDETETTNYFPDPVFRAYVANMFDVNGDGFLDGDEIAAVRVIDVYGETSEAPDLDGGIVASLQGVEQFPCLEELYCNPPAWEVVEEGLKEVDLSHNTKLKVVNLSCNPLTKYTDWGTVRTDTLTDLEELHVGFSNITDLSLYNNPKLKRLTVNSTKLTNLFLDWNPQLVWLDICDTRITELGISSCPNLKEYYRAGERHLDLPYLEGRHVYGMGDESVPYNLAFSDGTVVCTAVISAKAMCGETSIGDVAISTDGILFPGDEVTLTAPEAVGYRFLGWYFEDNMDEPQSTSRVFKTKVYDGERYVAVYEALDVNATVTLDVKNGAVIVLGSEEIDARTEKTVKVGTQLTLAAKDADKAQQWQNGSGKQLGLGATLEITVTGNLEIRLIYKENEASGSSYVQFVSDYGQVLKAKTYTAGESIEMADPPTKLGYNFVEWIFEGTNDPATADTIKAKVGTAPVITVKPKYERDETQKFTVTIRYQGADRADDVYENVLIGTSFTAVAPEEPGLQFQCWKEGDTILGYTSDYFFKVTRSVTLTAVYSVLEPDPVPVITISEITAVETGGKHYISAIVTRSIPDGYTLLEHGVLYARDVAGLDETTFVFGTEGVGKYAPGTTDMTGTVKLNVKVDTDNVVVSLRGFMILKNNKTGVTEYYYTAIRTGTYAGLQ